METVFCAAPKLRRNRDEPDKSCFNKSGRKSIREACLEALKKEKISKVNLIAFKKNEVGNRFWQGLGWTFREDVNYYEYVTNEDNITTYNP